MSSERQSGDGQAAGAPATAERQTAMVSLKKKKKKKITIIIIMFHTTFLMLFDSSHQ